MLLAVLAALASHPTGNGYHAALRAAKTVNPWSQRTPP